jgi:cytochrome c oxidase subunit 2
MTTSDITSFALQLQLTPPAASTEAAKLDTFFFFMVALCGSIALLIAVLVVYFAVRYRRRTPEQIALSGRSSRVLEIGWTVIPLGIFIFIFYWGAELYFSTTRAPVDSIPIDVVGKQWMWKFQHAEGQREINTLHVPLGRPVKLTVASQDVIHSFFVPAFRIHLDAVPGRYRTIWFQPTQVGTFHLFCSQYCGTQHSGMIGEIVVMPPDEYARWLTSSPEGSTASEGEKLFRQLSCNSCHTGDASARAPFLGDLYGQTVSLQSGDTVRADENYIRESIVDPQAKIVAGYKPIMPTFQGRLDEEQLMQLIAFIRSLRAGRQQIPPVSNPAGPQPSPVEDAVRQSQTGGNENANAR